MTNIREIERNNESIKDAVRCLNKARDCLENIVKDMEGITVSKKTDRSEILEKLESYLSKADDAQDYLESAKRNIKDVSIGIQWVELGTEYWRLRRTTSAVINKLKIAIGKFHVSGLDSKKVIDDISRLFNPSIERDRTISKHRAEEAKARAEEASQKAKEAEAREKEAAALKDVKQFELETLSEQNKQRNLELLNGIRANEAQIVAQAREAINVAKQAMAEAIKAEDIQKAKEQAGIIKQKSAEIAKISGEKVVGRIEKTHEIYEDVLKDIRQNISPMLVGPAGSGKSTVLQQIADTLNLKYYPLSVNGQTSEYQIIGYKNANGDYIRSAFREAFEFGGLFSFEEIDAGNPNVLTVMNNALSQDFYLFPDGCVKKHSDFRLAASANTYGRGANRQYIGRNPLDAATLDRFAMSYVDYDEQLELEIGPEPKWTDYVQTVRHVIESFGMPIIVSTRAVIFGGMDVKSGTKWETAAEKFIWRGSNPEDVEKVINRVKELQGSQKSKKGRQR